MWVSTILHPPLQLFQHPYGMLSDLMFCFQVSEQISLKLGQFFFSFIQPWRIKEQKMPNWFDVKWHLNPVYYKLQCTCFVTKPQKVHVSLTNFWEIRRLLSCDAIATNSHPQYVRRSHGLVMQLGCATNIYTVTFTIHVVILED